eukprot:SAG11_NODE_141_length_14934_cov_4.821503_20_plen_228_part_00
MSANCASTNDHALLRGSTIICPAQILVGSMLGIGTLSCSHGRTEFSRISTCVTLCMHLAIYVTHTPPSPQLRRWGQLGRLRLRQRGRGVFYWAVRQRRRARLVRWSGTAVWWWPTSWPSATSLRPLAVRRGVWNSAPGVVRRALRGLARRVVRTVRRQTCVREGHCDLCYAGVVSATLGRLGATVVAAERPEIVPLLRQNLAANCAHTMVRSEHRIAQRMQRPPVAR